MLFISNINYTRFVPKLKGPPRRKALEGFFLIELVIALLVGILLFSSGVFWQRSILDIYRETQDRLNAMQVVHELLAQMQHERALAKRKNFQTDAATISWDLQPTRLDGTHKNLPFIKDPQSFRFVQADASWAKDQRKCTFLAGVLLE